MKNPMFHSGDLLLVQLNNIELATPKAQARSATLRTRII